jgi:hypothetical protein
MAGQAWHGNRLWQVDEQRGLPPISLGLVYRGEGTPMKHVPRIVEATSPHRKALLRRQCSIPFNVFPL